MPLAIANPVAASSDLKVLIGPSYNRRELQRRLFNPGEQVTGIVRLILQKETEISHIEVGFRGKCKTWCGSGNSPRTCRIQMFNFIKTVLNGPLMVPSGTHDYPFTFVFPKTFTFRGSWYAGDSSPFTNHQGTHMLPPSCADLSETRGGYSINYKIRARIPRSILPAWKDKVTLNLATYRAEEFPDPSPVTRQANKLESLKFKIDDSQIPRPLSTRDSLKTVFHAPQSIGIGTVSFSLKVKAPTSIVIGKQYPLDMTLTTKGPTGVEVVPGFELKYFSLNLKSMTSFRVPAFNSDVEAILEAHTSINFKDVDVTLVPNTPKQFINMFAWKDQRLAPTFTSTAVRRYYWLELRTKIVCMGESHIFQLDWRDVNVHGTTMESQNEETTRTVGDVETAIGGVDLDPPPPYEECALDRPPSR
jgi:hypothetical protein